MYLHGASRNRAEGDGIRVHPSRSQIVVRKPGMLNLRRDDARHAGATLCVSAQYIDEYLELATLRECNLTQT